MYNANLATDLAPVAVVVTVAFAAGLPAYLIVSRAKRGRARSAIAYLLGFGAGLLMTSFLGGAMKPFSADEVPMPVVGLIASFIGPFIGMMHAKLHEPMRRRSRRSTSLQWHHSR